MISAGKIFLFILTLTLFGSSLWSQKMPSSITDQIEAFLEEENEDVDILNLVELLDYHYKNPLNINKVDYETLLEIRLLNPIQIQSILDHRSKFGDFIALEELQAIHSLDMDDIRRIIPFLKVSDDEKFQKSIFEMFAESENTIFLKWGQTLEQQKGFIIDQNGKSNFRGDPNRIFSRYRNVYENKMRFGFIVEKDAGELMRPFTDNLGFDYITAHFHLRDYSGLLKDFVVGDYTLSLGQGLISHNDFGSGKSAFVGNIIRGGRTIRSYNSVNENGYLRGLATTLRPTANLEVGVYLSNVRRDGNIQLDTLDNENTFISFSSLQTSGNHRTDSEIEDRNVVDVQSYGGTVKYKTNKFHIAYLQKRNDSSNIIHI